MRFALLIILLLSGALLSAQSFNNPYKFLSIIDSTLAHDTTPWKEQLAAFDYSYMGAYQQALSVADSQFKMMRKAPRLSVDDSLYLQQFRPVPADKYIIRRAASEQLIIINEAHHQPLHRTFVTSLLKGLYAQGYRYLGIETLGYLDSAYNQRKYPILETGFYSKEPQFGNLVREALRIGFTLFPYETQVPEHNNTPREIDQATNIANYMKAHPGKYLIYCGYDHVIEGPHRSWGKAMAGWLKEYTGIDPLTINQEALTEHSAPLYEKADYAAIQFPLPAVLVNVDGKTYNGYAKDSAYDIRLYHPRTRYVNGRPGWLSLNGTRKPFFIDLKKVKLNYPLLAFAYVEGEDSSKAVPYDIIEITSVNDKKALLLEKGAYKIVLKDQQQHAQTVPVRIN
jgi:hypothetical protein